MRRKRPRRVRRKIKVSTSGLQEQRGGRAAILDRIELLEGCRIAESTFRRSGRFRVTKLVFLFVVVALIAFVILQLKTPPHAARLLPECDAIAYADLKPIRKATHLESKPVAHSAEYQNFIDSTGIVLERDLDSVAFALTRRPDPNGPNGPVAFSEVFSGHFDGNRLARYLTSVATSREMYANQAIFVMPVTLPAGPASHMVPTGRILRVAQLDKNTVVASNAPTPEQIHAMIDRSHATGGPFSGPTLLAGLYSEVPLLSSVWGLGALGLPFAEDGRVTAFGLHLPFPDTTTFVASLRYTTSLGLRIEQIAPTEAEAARSVQKLNGLMAISRQMMQLQSLGANDAGARQIMDSLEIYQKNDRAILTAKIPKELLHGLAAAAR